MQLHANAALSLNGRRRMVCSVVEQGWSVTQAAVAAGVSERTCSKWVGRYRAEGEAGLRDRSSAPKRIANRTDEQTLQVILALRRLRFTGPEIAELLDRPLSTVSAVLKRCGMGKLGRLGLEPAERYERERPGELIHIDVKKLGRIQGGAGKRIWGGSSHYNRTFTDRPASVATRSAGTTSTLLSTTPHGWPTPRSCQTKQPPAPLGSCAARSRSSDVTACSSRLS